MFLLQEVGDWNIVPDIVMREEVDKLGLISLSAVNHHALIQGAYTIAIWWPKHKFTKPVSDLLSCMTGFDRPGSIRGAVVWTSNPNHRVFIEDPLRMQEKTPNTVLADIHLLHAITEFNISWKEYLILRMNKRALLEDSLNPHISRYLNSLKKADIYRFYSKGIR